MHSDEDEPRPLKRKGLDIPPLSTCDFYGSAAPPVFLDTLPPPSLRPLEPLEEADPSYAEFPKQEQAFKHIEMHPSRRMVVFSFEKGYEGRTGQSERIYRYVATTYDVFWERYAKMRSKMHYYEMIRENCPCNLYFDLEYARDLNPHHELDAQKDQAVVEAFITVCIAQMRELLSVQCERDDVIDLDSTTVQKFSRHLIFRLPGRAWASNAECGKFVRNLAAHLHTRQAEPMIAQFYVATLKPGRSLFVDTGVYTRNRNFRLMKSSKLGKVATLSRFHSEKELFFASLVGNVLSRTDLIRCPEVPLDATMPRLPPALRATDGRPYSSGPSRYPGVDSFIESILPKGAFLRSWVFIEETELLVYNVGGNRYCYRIGREHKSNHTMMVADISRGMCYQRCHDPDCKLVRDFNSPKIPLPAVTVYPGLPLDLQDLPIPVLRSLAI